MDHRFPFRSGKAALLALGLLLLLRPVGVAREAEADHAGSICLRERLRFGVRQAALEVLHVARRRSIAQEAGDAVRVADLRGAALAREQIDGAHGVIDVARESVETVVTRSQKLDAFGRLRVYANAYYARLVECLAWAGRGTSLRIQGISLEFT